MVAGAAGCEGAGMQIGLDYDNTYSADPVFFDAVIALALRAGHDIRIVTARDDRFDRTAPLVALERRVPVIYTRGVAKRFYLTHIHEGDFQPAVWMDDKPEAVLANSPTTPADLAEWRRTRSDGPHIGGQQ